MNKKYILPAALLAMSTAAISQTTVTFDSDDFQRVSVYDMWADSPFRTGALEGNAAVCDNPDTEIDPVLGAAPNSSQKVVGLQRSRYGSNAFGVRIDLKTPFRLTKQMQYVHVMAYMKDKPADSRMMVIGLGKRVEKSWEWQPQDVEQFYALTSTPVKAQAGWQDIVAGFKGWSYTEAEKADTGIDIYSLVIVPDVRSPHADLSDWVAYFDNIVVDNDANKRFTTEKYALNFAPTATIGRTDRNVNGVGLTVGGKAQTIEDTRKNAYKDHMTDVVFAAKPGQSVHPTFTYAGAWMSGYVYLDWNNDGALKYDVETNGVPSVGSDVVSYSAKLLNGTWYKSDGTTTSNGNTIGAGVPSFSIPADTPLGFYRMRYKVDWDNLDPAGSQTILSDGGGIIDVTLDIHGEEVNVSASQLNGDILVASDESQLQNTKVAYGQPLTIKMRPENGFIQNGFTLKYGYKISAAEQLDDNGNPNWILIQVPASAIAADGTYTIPGDYIRGAEVLIEGDMQSRKEYTVSIEGAPEGQGGISYQGNQYGSGSSIVATQYLADTDLTATPIEGYTVSITVDKKAFTVTVTYKQVKAYVQVTSLDQLSNTKAYQIKNKNGEGYLAWNATLSDAFVSIRGIDGTNLPNGLPSNEAVANIFKAEVTPFDTTVVWQILSDGDKYYLYQPALQCYVTRVGRDYKFTPNQTALDGIRTNSDGTFGFHAGGGMSDSSTNFVCIVTNSNPEAVRNWRWDDHGSLMYIIENPNMEFADPFLPTTITDVITTTPTTHGIYTLSGQRLTAPPSRGIVIVDGKKKVMQ